MGGDWIRRWDVETGQALVNIAVTKSGGTEQPSVLVSPDGKLVYVFKDVSFENGGKTWEGTEFSLENGKQGRTFRLNLITAVLQGRPRLISPDGKLCVEFGNKVILWNLADGSPLHQLTHDSKSHFTGVNFTPNSKSLLLAEDDDFGVRVWGIADGTLQNPRGFGYGTGATAIAVSPDGKWLAMVRAGDSFVRLMKLAGAELNASEPRTVDFPSGGRVESLLFTPDSRLIIAALKVSNTIVWNPFKDAVEKKTVRTGAQVCSWDVLSGNLHRLWTTDPTMGFIAAVSPDSKILATMNDAGAIRLWEIETGKEKLPKPAHTSGVTAVMFQQDGKSILTAGDDMIGREWDAATGRLLGPLAAPLKGTQPAFTPAGKLLLKMPGTSKMQLREPTTGQLLYEWVATEMVGSIDGRKLGVVWPTFPWGCEIHDVVTGEIQSVSPSHLRKEFPSKSALRASCACGS